MSLSFALNTTPTQRRGIGGSRWTSARGAGLIRKRTCSEPASMSTKCQKRTFAPPKCKRLPKPPVPAACPVVVNSGAPLEGFRARPSVHNCPLRDPVAHTLIDQRDVSHPASGGVASELTVGGKDYGMRARRKAARTATHAMAASNANSVLVSSAALSQPTSG